MGQGYWEQGGESRVWEAVLLVTSSIPSSIPLSSASQRLMDQLKFSQDAMENPNSRAPPLDLQNASMNM